MAEQSKDGHTTPVERVAANKRDARRGPHEGAVIDMLTQTISYASKAGFTRDLIAERLGLSPRTLRAYIDTESENRIHLDTVIRMVRDRSILGEDARAYLVHEIVREMGMRSVMIDADGDDKPVAAQFMEVSTWLGETANRIKEAGDEIDKDEAASIDASLSELIRQAEEMRGKLGGVA